MVLYEKDKTIQENAKSVANENSWVLISLRKFDENPANDYLKFSICKVSEDNYCTHLFNIGTDNKGFFAEGRYDFKTLEDAWEDFENRR